MNIKTGDLLAFRGVSWYSSIIRKWGGFTRYVWEGTYKEDSITHVGLAVRISLPGIYQDKLCILEAHAFKGIRLNPLDKVLETDYAKPGSVVYHRPFIAASGGTIAASALQYWTAQYAPFYQFLIAGLKLSQVWRRVTGRPIDLDKKKLHCSELITTALVENGFEWNKDPSVTTPQDVYEFNCYGPSTILWGTE